MPRVGESSKFSYIEDCADDPPPLLYRRVISSILDASHPRAAQKLISGPNPAPAFRRPSGKEGDLGHELVCREGRDDHRA